jgi:transcriptional regulator GlxA family with amidase domain
MASREFLAFVDRCQIALGTRTVGAVLSEMPRLTDVTEQLVLEGLVTRLRGALAARPGPAVPGAPGTAAVAARHAALARRAVSWLEQHHTEPLTADRLASALGVSRWHLARVLTSHTRHGVRWHLGQARIAHAERLMRTSDLSLKEIAARVGFANASELSRHFVASRGITPSAWRAAWR